MTGWPRIALLLALAAAACKPVKPDQVPAERPAEPSKAAATQAATREVVVARIGSRDITFGELEDRLNALPVYVRMRYQAPERKLEFLESYVEFEVLALNAAAEGFGDDPAVVDAMKSDLVSRHLRDKADREVRGADVAETAIVAYYESHPAEFHRPEQRTVAHVRVADEALARKVAFRARKVVALEGADPKDQFAMVAQKYSDDEATRKKGGALGRVPRLPGDGPALPPEVVAAAMRLAEPNDVSDPVRAADGWHVLFLETRHPPTDLTLDQARPRIVQALVDEAKERLRRETVERAVAGARVTIDDAVFRRVAGGDK